MTVPPFFIVGCGRSGTSLVRSLVNRHPEIAIPLESLFIVDYLKVADTRPLSVLMTQLVREPEVREWGINPRLSDIQDCRTIADAIARLHQLYVQTKGKSYWGQKTPRFVRHMNLLLSHFPDARFIHVVRDPRAVASSLIQSDVHRSNAYFGVKRWAQDVARGLEFERSHPDRTLRIRYEDLVRHVDETMISIAEFMDFDAASPWWHQPGKGTEEYSAFYNNIHANLDRQPTQRYIEKWRSRLSAADVRAIEAIGGEWMVELGYQQEGEYAEVPRSYKAYMYADRVAGIIRQLLKYLRYRRTYLFHLVRRKWKLGLLRQFVRDVNY